MVVHIMAVEAFNEVQRVDGGQKTYMDVYMSVHMTASS